MPHGEFEAEAMCDEELKVKDIEEIEDIKHGDYTYTDGVGNCSQSLAVRCAVALGSDRKEPSAVQIRMGGSVFITS